MSKKQQPQDGRSRRSFLKQAAVAGGGAAVLAASGQARAAVPVPAAGQGDLETGYRVTDHIRAYYRTARS